MTVYVLVHLLSEAIADVLVRFRCHKTALVGDPEKAFLMTSVAEDDRDALRFLWFDDPFSEEPKIIVVRFACVAFGLSSSPFLLNATLKHHIMMYESENPKIVQKLLQSLYALMTLFLETVMTLVLTSCTLKPNTD